MIKTVTVTNHLGESMSIDMRNPETSGLKITSITGLGPEKASINFTDYGSGDGSMYNSARVGTRNIVLALTFMELSNSIYWPDSTIEDVRQRTYRYFPVKKVITLRIETDNRTLIETGYVESNEPDIFSQQEGTQISIICANPYFTDPETVVTNTIPFAIVPNPSLLTDINGWSCIAGPGGTVVNSWQSGPGWSGPGFFRSTVTVAASDAGQTTYCPVIFVEPNTTYTASIWIRLSTMFNVSLRVRMLSDGLDTGITTVGTGRLCINGIWIRLSTTFTTSPMTNSVTLSIFLSSMGSPVMPLNGTWDLDAVQCELGAVLTPYLAWVGDDSTIRRNLMPNPSFETDLTGWSQVLAGGTGSASRVPGGVYGSWYMRNNWSYILTPAGGVTTASILCYSGDTYTISAYIRAKAALIATASIFPKCQFYNGTTATSSVTGTAVVCNMDTWTRISITVTVPSNSTHAQFSWNFSSTGVNSYAGQILDIDAVLCERNTGVGTYFENVNFTVDYTGEVETGVLFQIKALSTATNVTIKNLLTGELFTIDTTTWARILGPDTWPTFQGGDSVIVSTITGSKNAILYRGDTPTLRPEYNVVNSITRDSTWLKLHRGNNTFEIKADTGIDSLRFSVESPIVYEGV